MFRKKISTLIWIVFILSFVVTPSFIFAGTNEYRQVAKVLTEWKGNDVAALVKKIKIINPNKGVIESIRIVDKKYTNNNEIKKKIFQYQKKIKQNIIEVRRKYLVSYNKKYPTKARSLYGYGDIGSWTSNKDIGAAADFDWSLFGVDTAVSNEVAKGYERELALNLGVSESSNLAKEFDIVITPEGCEEASGVYGNKASKDWASRGFKNFTLITPEGKTITFRSGDIIAERANAQRMAKIRTLMSQVQFGNAYELLFDLRGNFHLEQQHKIKPEARKALQNLLGELDMFQAKRTNLSGGIIEMAAHLHHEVLSDSNKLKASDLLDKINKYASRGEVMKQLAGLSSDAIDTDMFLGKNGDPTLREAYDFIMDHKGLRKEELIKEYGKKLDKSEIILLGKNVELVLKRLSVIQFQHQIDTTMMIENKTKRNQKIQEIKGAFEAELPRKLYPEFHKEIFEALQKANKISNNDGMFKKMQKAIKSQKKLIEIERRSPSAFKKLNHFLEKTIAGKKIRSLQKKMYKLQMKYGLKPNNTPVMSFMESANKNAVLDDRTENSRGAGGNIVHYLGTAALFVGGVEAIKNAQTDAEMAIALGHAWATSTFYGMIASETYHGVSQGDPKKIGLSIMYMLIPETAIPALMKSLGIFAGNITKKLYFDDTLNTLYVLSNYFKNEKSKNIKREGSGSCEAELAIDGQTVSEMVQLLYTPGVHRELLEMHQIAVDKSKGKEIYPFASVYIVEKSLQNLKFYGEPAIFPTFAPLVKVTMAIKKINSQIDDISKPYFAGYIPKTVESKWLDEALAKKRKIPSGIKDAIRKLMNARTKQWRKIEPALAQAIAVTFKERCRAEKELSKGSANAQKMVDDLLDIFKKLSVEKPCLAALEEDGKYTKAMYIFSSDREVQMKAMKAVQKYKDTYSGILLLRRIVISKFQAATGREPVPVPLNGWPALVCDREIDIANANKLLSDLTGALSEVKKRLETVKSIKLKNNDLTLNRVCEKDAFRILLEGKYRQSYYKLVKNNYEWIQKNELYWFEVFDYNLLTKKISDSHKKISNARDFYSQGLKDYREKCLIETDQRNEQNLSNLPSGDDEDETVRSLPQEKFDEDNISTKKNDTGQTKPAPSPESPKDPISLNPPSKKGFETGKRGEIQDDKTQLSPVSPKPTVKPNEKDDSIDGTPVVVPQDGSLDTGKGDGDGNKDESNSDDENEKMDAIEKEWIDKIEKAYQDKKWDKLIELHTSLKNANQKRYNSPSITKRPYLKPAKLLQKYLTELSQKKWDWFEKDVPRYLNELSAKSRAEYQTLEGKVRQDISAKKGTKEEMDRCLAVAKKEAKALRSLISEAKKEHPEVLRKMHYDQGSAIKVLEHIKRFITQYKIPDNLNVSVEYKSSCIDSDDENNTKELKVSIVGSRSYHINPKKILTLKTSVNGGKRPIKIDWEGGNISPSGSTAIFTATTPGSYTVQMTAKDAGGQSKTDAVTIIVKKIDMPKLSGLPNEVYYGTSKIISVGSIEDSTPKEKPKENPSSNDPCKGHVKTSNPFDPCNKVVVTQESHTDDTAPGVIMISPIDEDVGGDAPIVAEEKEEEKEEEGEYEYIWQPAGGSGIEFDPESSSDPQVKVTFGNIGDVEIWAEVKKDGVFIGETEPIKTKIIPPKFTLNVEPKRLYIGDEAKATISVEPNIDDKFTDFTWLPMGDNAQKLIESQNGRSTTLKLTNIKPTTIEVLVKAKSPYYGDEIGSAKDVVSGKPYEVSMSKPKRLGKAPSIWDPIKGTAVEQPLSIAVFQDAEIHATITPQPKGKVSYRWSVTPDGCSISAPMSKSTNLNAHEVDTYNVMVKVTGEKGIELGKATGTFTTTISQRDMDVAKQKGEDQKKAQKLQEEARKLWKEGKLEQAIAKVSQAQKLTGKDKEIAKRLKAMQKEKKDLDSKLQEAESLISKGKFVEAKKVLDQVMRINDKYEKYKEVLKQLADAKKKAEKKAKEKKKQVAKILKNAKLLEDVGKLDEALVILKKGSKKFPNNQEIDSLLKEVQKQQNNAHEKIKIGQRQWKNGMLDKAVATLKEAGKIDPSNKKIGKVLKVMQIQKKIIDNALKKTDTLINQKKFKQAKETLVKAEYVSKKYPPYIQMVKKLDDAEKDEKNRKELLAQKVQEIKDKIKIAKEKERRKIEAIKRAEQIKKINEIKKAAEERATKAKAEEQATRDAKEAALKNRINDIRIAAEEAKKIQEEKDRKAELAQRVREIREAAEKAAKEAELAKKINEIRMAAEARAEAEEKEKALQAAAEKGIANSTQSNSIIIISATYGANCGMINGNVTPHIAKECNGKSSCRYTVDYKKIGDPAIGCRKTYSVQYRCGNNPQVIKRSLAREAGWGDKFLLLDCQQKNQPENGKETPPAVTDTPHTPNSEDNTPNDTQSTKVQAQYLGCYKDKGAVESARGRDISGNYFTSTNMTIAKCATTCQEKGFMYAGVQYAYGCFCGNSYGRDGVANNCNMPCTGNKNEICGGAWANSVYKLAEKGKDTLPMPPSNISSLVGSWSFGRSKHYGKPVQEHLCNLTLTDKFTEGIGYKINSCHANESYWILEGKVLLFIALDGTVTTRFTEVNPNYWEGTYVGSLHSAEGVVHYLKKSDEKVDDTKPKGQGGNAEKAAKEAKLVKKINEIRMAAEARAEAEEKEKALQAADKIIDASKPKDPREGTDTTSIPTMKKQTIKAKYGPPPSADTWTHYSIPLTAENFGVDTQTFQQVMTNIISLKIFTEMHNGKDVGCIDAVHIGSQYISNFSTGTDGWNAAGDGTMHWVSSGGSSGGYLQISDWASGEEHIAVAPAGWSGNWQRLIGSSIDFYYKTDHPSYGAVVEISSKPQNRLGVVAEPLVISQGGNATVSISPYPVSSKDISISITSSNTKCMTVPKTVLILAGQTKIDVKVNAMKSIEACDSVITASATGYGESRITLSVKEKAPVIDDNTAEAVIVSGKTKTSTTYTPNTKGDVFNGGHWAGASGRSDWLQKDFSSPQLVTGVYIGRASTDITTKGFRLVLKLKKSDGQWITIDELHDTNINRTALSGGAVGRSIPSYTKKLSPAIKATAFRLEFYGHGWFDATDVRIYTGKSSENITLSGLVSGKEKPASKNNSNVIIAGRWNTTEGGGMTLHRSKQQISGIYDNDDGKIIGKLEGSILNGYWSEKDSNKRCDKALQGRFHWGRIIFNFKDDKFTGVWGYCNDKPAHSWTGTKVP